jgi:hypothetical protein
MSGLVIAQAANSDVASLVSHAPLQYDYGVGWLANSYSHNTAFVPEVTVNGQMLGYKKGRRTRRRRRNI